MPVYRRQPILFLVFLLALAACRPRTAPSPMVEQPSPAPSFTARTLTVLAAASLNESFTDLGKIFEEQNPGTKVSFSFAGSQQLAQQLAQGAEADVFASASQKYMDAAVEAKRVDLSTVSEFAKNQLVVIFPKDNPAGLKEVKDLARPGTKLVLADQTVPVGQYSLDFLAKAAQDPDFGAGFEADVLKNVVSHEDNVKAVLAKNALGEADAGIVYVSDITPEAAGKVGVLNIPDALNTLATYPVAPISDSENPDLARAFIALLRSPKGQAVLMNYGFLPAVEAPDS